MPLTVTLNGDAREFSELTSPVCLAELVASLGLKGDRVAVEHNGEIVARAGWGKHLIAEGDGLEVVHFVGGGTGSSSGAVAYT